MIEGSILPDSGLPRTLFDGGQREVVEPRLALSCEHEPDDDRLRLRGMAVSSVFTSVQSLAPSIVGSATAIVSC